MRNGIFKFVQINMKHLLYTRTGMANFYTKTLELDSVLMSESVMSVNISADDTVVLH